VGVATHGDHSIGERCFTDNLASNLSVGRCDEDPTGGTGAGTTDSMLTWVELPAGVMPMIRAIIDDRIRRVWAILIGMSMVAVTVAVVTIVIHDRIQ
jgi:hypothetical protein